MKGRVSAVTAGRESRKGATRKVAEAAPWPQLEADSSSQVKPSCKPWAGWLVQPETRVPTGSLTARAEPGEGNVSPASKKTSFEPCILRKSGFQSKIFRSRGGNVTDMFENANCSRGEGGAQSQRLASHPPSGAGRSGAGARASGRLQPLKSVSHCRPRSRRPTGSTGGGTGLSANRTTHKTDESAPGDLGASSLQSCSSSVHLHRAGGAGVCWTPWAP